MAVMTKTPPKKVRPEVYRNPGSPVAKRVKDLLSRMTLEQKAAQMMCVWQQKAETLANADGDSICKKPKPRSSTSSDWARWAGQAMPARAKNARGMAELTNAIQKFFIENNRLGIPVIFHEECWTAMRLESFRCDTTGRN